MTTGPVCPISKLENILLATDGTEHSEGAIREAIRFAAKCSSKLYACITLEASPEYETIGSDAFQEDEINANLHLESIKARAEKEGLACETIFHEFISAAQAIIDEATAKKAGMIIIGRRGYKGADVAAKVITEAPCKVMIVPRFALIEYKNMLVATDGSPHAGAAVKEAIAIAKRCGSHLTVLSAIRDEGERGEAVNFTNMALELAKNEGLSAEALISTGKSSEVIVEIAGGRGFDLIVMGAYGKTGIKKFVMGSSTEKVIGTSGCAVLVVKAD
jgi:nucleotide-binding universal stress UspA family protein